jgi:hypothetical protein
VWGESISPDELSFNDFLRCLMNAKRTFALHPLSAALKWMTLLPLVLTSTHSLARIIDGGPPVTIDGSVAIDQ